MKNILILYYSGVGNTKEVAGIIFNHLCMHNGIDSIAHFSESVPSTSIHASSTATCNSSSSSAFSYFIYSIEKLPIGFDINYYDGIILGFPTIHSEPAIPILNFINRLSCLEKRIPAFLFTTCGLYSTNTLRIFAQECIKKNIIPVLNKTYRCAAIDGILLAPYMKCWFKHEKRLKEKVEGDAVQFVDMLQSMMTNNDRPRQNIPRIKLYSILNFPNKELGKRFPFTIYLHKEKCVKCKQCVNNCPANAYTLDKEGFPLFDLSQCIHCYRCIHHCPQFALSLSKKKTPSKTLYRQ